MLRAYLNDPNSASKAAIDNLDPILKPGLESYKAAEYQKAIQFFEDVEDENYKMLALQYIGEIYLKLDQFDQAITTFQDIVSRANEDDPSKSRAEWFLVLAYYLNQDEQFEDALNQIVNSDTHRYQATAKDFKEKNVIVLKLAYKVFLYIFVYQLWGWLPLQGATYEHPELEKIYQQLKHGYFQHVPQQCHQLLPCFKEDNVLLGDTYSLLGNGYLALNNIDSAIYYS